jgi:hypothetical protein
VTPLLVVPAARETVHSSGSARFWRRWFSWLRTVITSIGTTTIRSSRPSRRVLCGIRARAELTTTSSSVARVSAAWAGRNLAALSIRSRLIETATNNRPVRPAAAAIIAVKNGTQAAGS